MCPLPLKFSTTGKSPWITNHPCYRYLHSPMLLCLQDTPKYSPMSWESFAAYCFRTFFLPACIMVNSICLGILHRHPLSLPYWSYGSHRVRECTQSSINLINSFFGSDVIPDMSWRSVNQTFVGCPYKSVQLIYPWSEHLLLISPFLKP